MLTELDDLLTHQTFETHDRVFMDDPRWTERFIIEVHDPAGGMLDAHGSRDLPEHRLHGRLRGRVAGWRAAQPAGGAHARPRPVAARCRAARFEIVDPMRAWRMFCEAGKHGFAFDLTFARRTQPYQMPTQRIERDGFLLVGISHFVQAGTYSGWIEIEGVVTASPAGPASATARGGAPASAGSPRRGLSRGCRCNGTTCRSGSGPTMRTVARTGSVRPRSGRWPIRTRTRGAGADHPLRAGSRLELVGRASRSCSAAVCGSRVRRSRATRSRWSRWPRCCRSSVAGTAAKTPRALPRGSCSWSPSAGAPTGELRSDPSFDPRAHVPLQPGRRARRLRRVRTVHRPPRAQGPRRRQLEAGVGPECGRAQTVRLRSRDDRARKRDPDAPPRAQHLAATAFIDADHPVVRDFARRAVGGGRRPRADQAAVHRRAGRDPL